MCRNTTASLRSRILPVLVVTVVGMVASHFTANSVFENARQQSALTFEHKAADRILILEREIAGMLEIVHSLAALYDASKEVERSEFRSFVRSLLERHTTIQALEWVPQVAATDRAAFVQQARSQGLTGFEITKRGPEGRFVSPDGRRAFYPVLFVEPMKGNEPALGFDLGSDQDRRRALEKARDTGDIVATGRITLIQESGVAGGFLVFKPVYRKDARLDSVEDRRAALLGLVLAVLRTDKLMAAVQPQGRTETVVHMNLLDESGAANEKLLYESIHVEPDRAFSTPPYRKRIPVGGRSWLIECHQPDGSNAHARWLFFLTYAAGLALALTVASYVFVILGRKSTIERQVTLRTEELNLAKERLEEHAKALESLNQELLTKNAALDEFSYMASHDLKEPLRKLQAFSQLLGKDLGDDLNEHARKDLEFIQDASARMEALISDLLMLSRTASADPEFRQVDVQTCAKEALHALGSRIAEADAEIRTAALPVAWGDVRMLTQLFQNLISNALKFTNGDAPRIELTCERRNGSWLLGVKDNGIGIAEEEATRIFLPFKRLHGRNVEGTGIGLAICKKMVERLGGEIWVESCEGQGAHFRFTLNAVETSP